MLRSIWKYPLEVTDLQVLELPGFSARPLSVQVQRGGPCLWALVEPDAEEKFKYQITTVCTGQLLQKNPPWNFLGTYQLEHSGLVFHVFSIEMG